MADGFSIKGRDELLAALGGFSDRRMAAAMATALTRTAKSVQTEILRQLPQVFDRPTPYTLRSLYVRPAAADKLEAQVRFKDDRATSNGGTPATYYLMPQVTGGERRSKRFDRALQANGLMPDGWLSVPGPGARIDAYGNLDGGQIKEIMGQLRSMAVAGKSLRKAGGRFFAVLPGQGKLPPGVYQRELFGANVTQVIRYVRSAKYSKRFDFDGLAQAVAERELPGQMARALNEHIERLRAKGGA